MSRFRGPWQAWLLTLVSIALLWARVGGTHLHLCFDGQEPAASVHLNHGDHHAEAHGGHHHAGEEQHNDLDVPMGDDALAKPGKSGLDLPTLLAATLLLLLFGLGRAGWSAPGRLPGAARPARCLRPPLRGPPAPAFAGGRDQGLNASDR